MNYNLPYTCKLPTTILQPEYVDQPFDNKQDSPVILTSSKTLLSNQASKKKKHQSGLKFPIQIAQSTPYCDYRFLSNDPIIKFETIKS